MKQEKKICKLTFKSQKRKSRIKSSYIHVKRLICVPISFTRFTREKIVPQINVSHQNVGNNYFLHKCKEKQNKIKFFYKSYLVPIHTLMLNSESVIRI